MTILGLLLPTRCAACGAPGASPCPTCASRLRPAPVLAPPAGLDSFAALVRYDDTARSLVTAVKYRNARASVDGLAPALAALVPDDVRATLEAVTWAPTTPARRRRRGFDQTELLARAVAGHLGLRARRTLRRAPGPHQTGRRAAERLGGPRFDAVGPAAGPRAPSGAAPGVGTVLLVDDVCTTGATLASAGTALRDAGARAVHAVVVARTPAREARR